jgi:ketosteroid isomerase-like protein
MSEENVELAASVFRPGDPSRFFDLLDEEVEFDATAYPGPGVVTERGRKAVVEAFREIWRTYDDYVVEAAEIVDAGDSVVIDLYERATGKGSGVTLDRHHGHVWTFSEGKIVRIRVFRTTEEALDAVGLPP